MPPEPGPQLGPTTRSGRLKLAGGRCLARTSATQSSTGKLALDEAERAPRSPAASTPAALDRARQHGHGLERLDRLAHALGISAAGHPARAALRRRGCATSVRAPWPPVAGPSPAHEGARLAAARGGQRQHLQEDVGSRHSGRVESLRRGWRRLPRRRRSGHPGELHADGVIGTLLAHHARALGRPRPPGARAPRSARAHKPRPVSTTPSARGAADACHALGAEDRFEQRRRVAPSGGTSPASDTIPARPGTPIRCSSSMAVPISLEGTASKTRSARPNRSGSAPRPYLRSRGSSTPGR